MEAEGYWSRFRNDQTLSSAASLQPFPGKHQGYLPGGFSNSNNSMRNPVPLVLMTFQPSMWSRSVPVAKDVAASPTTSASFPSSLPHAERLQHKYTL